MDYSKPFTVLHFERCPSSHMANHLVNAIFGKREIGQLTSADYIDWAGEMLVYGSDSRSLRILAALDKFTASYEAEDYFRRSIEELSLELPPRDVAIRSYACDIARQMKKGRIPLRDGVRALFQICIATDYPPEFIVWYELCDALDSLLYKSFPHTYPSATLEDFDEIAEREAVSFLASVCSEI
jgi:hypothetical protein